VLASRGSVIPLFHDQVRRGGPVTVTIPEMTRFLLSLEQAVDIVIAAIAGAGRGETFVPHAPSATVINIAKALVGDRPVEVRVTGIRPGEKMHEVLVSEEEFPRTVRRDDYYAIAPLLPELQTPAVEGGQPLTRELSSAHTVIDFDETLALLRRHHLMVGEATADEAGELLR
jgi:UDP-glucose 4-epimerase